MLKPLGSRCVVEAVKQVQKLDSGFFIDEANLQAPQSLRVKIVAIGNEVKTVVVGDEVFVSQFAPTEAREKVSDKTLVIPEEDILAVVIPDNVSKP
jgi:co-chaperonin GroES (HSP10)